MEAWWSYQPSDHHREHILWLPPAIMAMDEEQMCYSALQFLVVRCSVLRYSALQCVVVCCSV